MTVIQLSEVKKKEFKGYTPDRLEEILQSNKELSQTIHHHIMFAQNALVLSNQTDYAFKYISGWIDTLVKGLEDIKKSISTTLANVKNNQVIYLGNDARKEIDKAISETEEWLEEVQKYDWLKL